MMNLCTHIAFWEKGDDSASFAFSSKEGIDALVDFLNDTTEKSYSIKEISAPRKGEAIQGYHYYNIVETSTETPTLVQIFEHVFGTK